MSKAKNALQSLPAPVHRAMIFICEKCGKRCGDSVKHASHELASNLKRAAKKQFGKGEIRVILTSCMDACPQDRIAISLQTLEGAAAPLLLQADAHDVEAGSDALLKLVSYMSGR